MLTLLKKLCKLRNSLMMKELGKETTMVIIMVFNNGRQI